MIKNVNTIEEYRTLDKGAILSQSGRTASQHHVFNSRVVVKRLTFHRYGTR